jgi:hypothetical protein
MAKTVVELDEFGKVTGKRVSSGRRAGMGKVTVYDTKLKRGIRALIG